MLDARQQKAECFKHIKGSDFHSKTLYLVNNERRLKHESIFFFFNVIYKQLALVAGGGTPAQLE